MPHLDIDEVLYQWHRSYEPPILWIDYNSEIMKVRPPNPLESLEPIDNATEKEYLVLSECFQCQTMKKKHPISS